MDRRNFLSVLSGIGTVPIWDKLQTKNDTEPLLAVDRFHENTNPEHVIFGRVGAGSTYGTKVKNVEQFIETRMEVESPDEKHILIPDGNPNPLEIT